MFLHPSVKWVGLPVTAPAELQHALSSAAGSHDSGSSGCPFYQLPLIGEDRWAEGTVCVFDAEWHLRCMLLCDKQTKGLSHAAADTSTDQCSALIQL